MALKLAKKTKVQKVVKKAPVMRSSKGSAPVKVFATPKGVYTEAVGRRKTATARVRIFKTDGEFVVNDKIVGEYFDTVPHAHAQYLRPFELTGTKGTYAVTAKVSGSGKQSQLDAVVMGVARALAEVSADYRTLLLTENLLTRDDRMKETRKIGMGGKARRKRQSPKR
jgi:small subunit ribosomal protein S9